MEAPVNIFAEGILQGRVALVTGSGSGIGLAISKRLAALGAKVGLLGRRVERLSHARAKIERDGGAALEVPADVRDFDAVSRAVAAIVEQWGALDIMINNAAGTFVLATEDISANGWRTVVDIDLNGTFHCCKAAFPHLKNSSFGGRIISITTDKARTGWPGCAHAGAAKAGIVSLTRTLAQEWGGYGIRANTIAPGPIEGTEGADRLYEREGVADRELATIPLRRFGRASEIADTCVFLASDAGSFINGADIVVDGGRAWHTANGTPSPAH